MIKIVGVGPGNRKLVTLEALEEIKKAEKVYAFKRIRDDFSDIRDDILIIEKLLNFNYEDDSVILASGDPLFYGIAQTLKNKGYDVEVTPGVSSCQYFLTRLNLKTHDFNAISLHGRDFNVTCIKKGINVFFTDSINTPDEINRRLKEKGFEGYFAAGFDLSYDFEKIIRGKVGDDFKNESKLALAVYINEVDQG